jgi:predicted RecA/RadA family phage recombinase
MATNEVYEDADNLYLPVISGVVSGGPVIVGMIPGVALTTRDSAGKAMVRTRGAYRVPVGTGAIASVGLPVYITSATGVLGIVPGAGIQLFGHALETKASGAATILVRLAQFAVASDVPA